MAKANLLKRFWISWICREEDHRPISYPPKKAILGWWCSGYDPEGNAVLCAAVEADDPGNASAAIFADWPEAAQEMKDRGWRFFEHDKGPEWVPSDRFPLEDWMKKRFSVPKEPQ